MMATRARRRHVACASPAANRSSGMLRVACWNRVAWGESLDAPTPSVAPTSPVFGKESLLLTDTEQMIFTSQENLSLTDGR